MSDREKCTLTPGEQLRARQQQIREIRRLLRSDTDDVSEGLRRLFGELLVSKRLWFDEIGRIASLEQSAGLAFAMVELALCLAFPAEWPPDHEDPQ